MKKYLPNIRIKSKEKRAYWNYINSKGKFRALDLLFWHITYIFINYFKFSKEQKKTSYIEIRYNSNDNPILSIDCE